MRDYGAAKLPSASFGRHWLRPLGTGPAAARRRSAAAFGPGTRQSSHATDLATDPYPVTAGPRPIVDQDLSLLPAVRSDCKQNPGELTNDVLAVRGHAHENAVIATSWSSSMPATLLAILLTLSQAVPTPEIDRLSNGLQVIVLRDRTAPAVSVQLWYRVGSADTPPRQGDLCDRVRTVLQRRLDHTAPIPFDGATLRDACYFAALVPAERVGDALRSLTAVVAATPIDAAEITVAPAPGTLESVGQRLVAPLFGERACARTWDTASLSADAANNFLRGWFVPENGCLIVIGDVVTPAIHDEARRLFGDVPWAEGRRRPPWPVPIEERIDLPADTAAPAGLDIAWLTPPANDDQNLVLDVLIQRLCNTVDGPLYRRLTDLGCWPPRWHRAAWRDAGVLKLSVDRRPDSAVAPDDVVRAVFAELEGAEEVIAAEIELNRARALAVREVRLRRLDFAARALELGRCELIGGDILLAAWEIPRLQHVNVGDLQKAATLLRNTRTVVAPRTGAPATSRPTTRRAAVATTLPTGNPSKQLDEFVVLTVAPRPGVELIEVHTAPRPSNGLAAALDALMAVGTTAHSVDQIRDYLTYHGLDLYPRPAGMPPGLVSRGPASHMAQMIEWHAELLRHPNATPAACTAAAEHGRALQRWLAHRHGDDDLYAPAGFIGWRAGHAPLTDAEAIRTALAPLATVNSVAVTIVGDVDADEACTAAREAWSDPQPPASQRSP